MAVEVRRSDMKWQQQRKVTVTGEDIGSSSGAAGSRR